MRYWVLYDDVSGQAVYMVKPIQQSRLLHGVTHTKSNVSTCVLYQYVCMYMAAT